MRAREQDRRINRVLLTGSYVAMPGALDALERSEISPLLPKLLNLVTEDPQHRIPEVLATYIVEQAHAELNRRSLALLEIASNVRLSRRRPSKLADPDSPTYPIEAGAQPPYSAFEAQRQLEAESAGSSNHQDNLAVRDVIYGHVPNTYLEYVVGTGADGTQIALIRRQLTGATERYNRFYLSGGVIKTSTGKPQELTPDEAHDYFTRRSEAIKRRTAIQRHHAPTRRRPARASA